MSCYPSSEWERRRDIERKIKRDRERQVADPANPDAEEPDHEEEEQQSEGGGEQDADEADVGPDEGPLHDFPDPHLGGELGPALDLDTVEPAHITQGEICVHAFWSV
jgi:hypothetical protein